MNLSGRTWLWALPFGLWALFTIWYTDFKGPLTSTEIERFSARLEAMGAPPERIQRLRRFMEEDSGRQFIMVNALDLTEEPPTLPATGPGAPAEALMAHYMEHMYPALFRRACHPVFAGMAVFPALDLVGIAGAENWTRVGLMRYRSRRDMLEISTNPVFGGRHEYKVAALEKTIAFPVETQLYLSDPRWLLALLLLAIVGLADRMTFGRN